MQITKHCDINSSQPLSNFYFNANTGNPDDTEDLTFEAGRLGKCVTWSGNTNIEFTAADDASMPKYNLEVKATNITFKGEQEASIPTDGQL